MIWKHRRVTIVNIEIDNGSIVSIPLMDLIHAPWEEGQSIFAGWVYDIFAAPKGEKSKEEVLV